MDLNQLIIALIGAFSTLLAAWVTSRSTRKPGVTPSRRSARRTVIRFGFYFLLGGAATYWVMNSLLPFGRIEERLNTLEIQAPNPGAGFVQARDSLSLFSLPVGSVILSALAADQFAQLPGGSAHWVPADGRIIDSSSYYVVLTGSTRVPDMRVVWPKRVGADSIFVADSIGVLSQINENDRYGTVGGTALYWYIRVN